jgi:hypothetical protein
MSLEQINGKKDSTQRFPTDRCEKCGKNLMQIDEIRPDSGYNYLMNSDLICTACKAVVASKI